MHRQCRFICSPNIKTVWPTPDALGNRSTTTIGSPKKPPKTTTLKQKKQQIAAAVSTIELK